MDGSSPARSKRGSDNAGGKAAQAHPAQTTKSRTAAAGGEGFDEHGQQQPQEGGADGALYNRVDGGTGITWKVFRGSTGSTAVGNGQDNNKRKKGNRFGRNKKILPSDGGFGGGDAHEGEAVTDPLVPPGQQTLSTDLPTVAATPKAGAHESMGGYGGGQGQEGV